MLSYQQFQQQFVRALVGAPEPFSGGTARTSAAMLPSLVALLDALPYYGDPDWESAHRGALVNLLEASLPNATIAPRPPESAPGISTSYNYTGSFSGYQAAFFSSIGRNGPATGVASLMIAVNRSLDDAWWGNYAVAVLTDAIRVTIALALDTSKLAADLSSYHATLLPSLSASVLGIHQNGFLPTATALAALSNGADRATAVSELTDALSDQVFTANVNEAIAAGGDSTNAATWFLYNLWITLKALGSPDVDAAIRNFQSGGLAVPPQVGPASWWNGGYATWYPALSGADVSVHASPAIMQGMPEEQVTTVVTRDGPSYGYSATTEPNGFSNSLAYWGSLSRYVPPPTSCFGRGTGVLMADGTVKKIEHVHAGDQVRSRHGPARVVLVERPLRAQRTLYRLNDLNLLTTPAHPFRAAPGAGPGRLALDMWGLLDVAPTMIGRGVGPLDHGVTLAGCDGLENRDIVVEAIATLPPGGAASDERVFDLILEGREKSFYVGGPQLFCATDSETSDPYYDVPSTFAVVAALRGALASCRRKVRDPAHTLSSRVARLPFEEAVGQAAAAVWLNPCENDAAHEIPGPDFYMDDGEWDAHASLLESHLVRHFGRRLRRELNTGWRKRGGAPPEADQLVIDVHDVELVDHAGVPPGAVVELELRLMLRDPFIERSERVLFAASRQRRWHLVVDTPADFGAVPCGRAISTLTGSLSIDGDSAGRFRAELSGSDCWGLAQEHFLFAPSGRVVGRVAIERRWVSANAREDERRMMQFWTQRQKRWMAVQLGQRLGIALSKAVEE